MMDFFIFGESKLVPKLPPGVKRVGNDWETEHWGGLGVSRPAWPTWRDKRPAMQLAPQVNQLYASHSSTSGEVRTRLEEKWIFFLHNLNPWSYWSYISRKNAGLFNGKLFTVTFSKSGAVLSIEGDSNIELLAFGDQLVKVLDEYRGFSRIETLSFRDGPNSKWNHWNNPTKIHRFTVVTERNRVTDPQIAIDTGVFMTFPLVTDSEVWIESNKLLSY